MGEPLGKQGLTYHKAIVLESFGHKSQTPLKPVM